MNSEETIIDDQMLLEYALGYVNGKLRSRSIPLPKKELKKEKPEEIITEHCLRSISTLVLTKSIGMPHSSYEGISYEKAEFHRLALSPQQHENILNNINLWTDRAFGFYKNWSGRSIEELKLFINCFYEYVSRTLQKINAVSFINTTFCETKEVRNLVDRLNIYEKEYKNFATTNLEYTDIDRLGLLELHKNNLDTIKQIAGLDKNTKFNWYSMDILIPLYLKEVLEQSADEKITEAAYKYVLSLDHEVVTPRDMKFVLESIVSENGSRIYGRSAEDLYKSEEYKNILKASKSNDPGMIMSVFCNQVETGELLSLIRQDPYIINIKLLGIVNKYLIEQKFITI